VKRRRRSKDERINLNNGGKADNSRVSRIKKDFVDAREGETRV
jgi:hypothetical protein